MGSAFDTWTNVTGAYYPGAGTAWEEIWLVVSIAMLVVALFVGSRHELDAYRKQENNKN